MGFKYLVMGFLGGLILVCFSGTTDQSHKRPGIAAHLGSQVTGSSVQTGMIRDDGVLVSYLAAARRDGASTNWHAVRINEQHALHAIGGSILVPVPNRTPIRLSYERHVEHPNGNWTWIGRTEGGVPGTEAIITFGEHAVFGEIPNEYGRLLELTTIAGQVWLSEEINATTQVSESVMHDDFLRLPNHNGRDRKHAVELPAPLASAMSVAAAADVAANAAVEGTVTGSTTVDLVLGYTKGFAERLGGRSQAVTRLTFMVDVANQGYVNSQVDGALRLVSAIEVDYPDDTSNRAALFQLSGLECTPAPGGQLPDGGVSCTSIDRPAELQSLINARDEHGADVVALVRQLVFPENQSCGLSWLLGGGQSTLNARDADFALSVVSDSSGNQFPDDGNSCRNDTLAHEIGHLMGLQHDREIARGNDDTDGDGDLLDSEEYGALPYSFGYVDNNASFYTIMALRRSNGTGLRVFSNPRITCVGVPCGVANVADNARALRTTLPIVAAFRGKGPVQESGDMNNDGKSDFLWRGNTSSDNFVMWFMNGATRGITRSTSLSTSYRVVATGDFNGDNKLDVVWRAGGATRLRMWLGNGAGGFTGYWIESEFGPGWEVVGTGDLNGNGKTDLLWRGSGASDNFVMWFMNGPSIARVRTTSLSSSYRVVATGDFNGDERLDVVWRSGDATRLRLWQGDGTGGFDGYWIESQLGAGWDVVGAGDLNGNGKTDLLWRGSGSTDNVVFWFMSGPTIARTRARTMSTSYHLEALGDFNGDERLDMVWRAGEATRVRMWLGDGLGAFNGYWIEPTFGAGWHIAP
jgi:peptidyl-Asp metalloendopeptidase